MTERTLDWKPNWDEKNALFAVATMGCFAQGMHLPRVRRNRKVWLDQGREGACTGFGTAHALATPPLPWSTVDTEMARALYLEAQRQDEWEGEDYSGSSINGVMKAARLAGYISEWYWCQSLLEVRHALSNHGPVVIGVNWYEGMFDTDEQGSIHVTGQIMGGHALMLAGYKTLKDGTRVYRLENSWGQDWGHNGGCWITESDLQRLLEEHGEFACPEKNPL